MSTTNASLALALSPEVLALLAASYGKPADVVVQKITAPRPTKASASRPKGDKKASKLAAVKAEAETVAKPEKREVPVAYLPIDLPAVGTYDAVQFLSKIRALGPVFVGNHSGVDDPNRVQEACGNRFSFVQRRDAAMKLIAGFVGFDRRGPFGAQLDMARQRAMRQLSPVRKAPTATYTVAGYVAGRPDAQATKVQDLLARERVAAEEMIEHTKAAETHMANGNLAEAHLSGQLALVEQGRLEAIRADLCAMGIDTKTESN